jgi:hypothetical protein
MKERVYRFKRTAENLPSIARGIDPNEKNHHILNLFTSGKFAETRPLEMPTPSRTTLA